MAYCPFRRTYLPAAGHRSSKVIPWPAAKVDFKAHRQSLWSSRVYPQPAGRIWPAYTLLFKGSGELDRPGGCHSGHGAWLLKPYPRRYADASGRTAALALPLAFPPANPRAAKRQPAGARSVHGAVCVCRLDAADIARKWCSALVIADDQLAAISVQSFY